MKRVSLISMVLSLSFFFGAAFCCLLPGWSNSSKSESGGHSKTWSGHGHHHRLQQARCQRPNNLGELVPYGLAPGNQYSDNKPYPWRAGANENTTIEFNKDVLVEGNKLPAGKYGIHMIPSEKEWVIIFSKNNSAWGSFAYNQEEDALRVTVKPTEAPHQEWLVFGFENLAGNSATAFLHWEKIKVPIKIELPK